MILKDEISWNVKSNMGYNNSYNNVNTYDKEHGLFLCDNCSILFKRK